uniref:Kinesin motor domain-containing protein n=1 Tax=Oryza barthii TaxID=65489 RepID=A0A0D3F3S2_9ORYZ
MDGFASLVISSSPSRLPPVVDPATVAAAEDGSGGGGSFRPLSPPSRGRSNGGGGDRVWTRRRWRRPRVDLTVVAPPAADPATAAPPWHGGQRILPSPVCWQHLPDLAISSPLARIPWFFRSLLRGSAVRCDGMVGFGDLLLSRSDPVVSLRPALADPPPATTGVSRSGGVDPPCRRRFCTRGPYTAPLSSPSSPEDVRTACVYVESLTKELVFTTKDVTQLLVKGLSNRRTGVTSANADSSRSHCVFTCVIKSESKVEKMFVSYLDM